MVNEIRLPRKYFTRAEAEKMLPLVRVIVRDIVVNHRALSDRINAYEKALEAARRGASSNGWGDPRAIEGEIESLHQVFANSLEELGRLGVMCRDPERGLVEFPTLPGQLTWTMGEDTVCSN